MADPNDSLRFPGADARSSGEKERAAKLAALGIIGSATSDEPPPAETPHADPDLTKVIPQAQPQLETPIDLKDAAPLATRRGYTVLRKLGDGSYGDVYEARAPGGFRVAIKQLRRSGASNQGEIESLEAMKAMSHPFLVQMHAYWVEEDSLEIVMELAAGSLAGRLEHHVGKGRTGVPTEELIPYFEQAGEALDYLHAQKVSHRDVKPENLLLLKGYAKVADFGLAREHEHNTTQVATEQGTPLYMAPEVWARKVSLHSDQYSLASTYVMARLGRRLFQGKNLFELAYQHSNETPDLEPLPLPEQKVLLKALSKEPDGRYPSCSAFAKALRTAVFPPAKTAPRRTAWWIVAATLLIGIGVGFAVKYLQPDPREEIKPLTSLWLPDGWKAQDGAGVATTAGGMGLHKRLTRRIANQELVAILIVPRPASSDPPAFYMLENKVTRGVFRTVWDRADQKSQLHLYRKEYSEDCPGDWKKNASPDDVPVLGVTVPEAILVAAELGGMLPIYSQWQKAVGVTGDDTRPGPAGEKEKPGEKLADRNLAVGIADGPWPVTKKTSDVSIHEIHQLVSNGVEWTDGEPKRFNLFDRPLTTPEVRFTGQSWKYAKVLTFDRIREEPMSTKWTDTEAQAGFRIVLIPPALAQTPR